MDQQHEQWGEYRRRREERREERQRVLAVLLVADPPYLWEEVISHRRCPPSLRGVDDPDSAKAINRMTAEIRRLSTGSILPGRATGCVLVHTPHGWFVATDYNDLFDIKRETCHRSQSAALASKLIELWLELDDAGVKRGARKLAYSKSRFHPTLPGRRISHTRWTHIVRLAFYIIDKPMLQVRELARYLTEESEAHEGLFGDLRGETEATLTKKLCKMFSKWTQKGVVVEKHSHGVYRIVEDDEWNLMVARIENMLDWPENDDEDDTERRGESSRMVSSTG